MCPYVFDSLLHGEPKEAEILHGDIVYPGDR